MLKSSIADFRHLWHLKRLSEIVAASGDEMDANDADDCLVFPTFDALPWSHVLHACFSFLLSSPDPKFDLTIPEMMAVCMWEKLEAFEPPAFWSKVAPCSHPKGSCQILAIRAFMFFQNEYQAIVKV